MLLHARLDEESAWPTVQPTHLINQPTNPPSCLLQARLDEESAALAKRQQNFHRDRDQMSSVEEEGYERGAEQSLFRIAILEKRLRRHEEQALHKYYELDAKLRGDSRLAALLNSY